MGEIKDTFNDGSYQFNYNNSLGATSTMDETIGILTNENVEVGLNGLLYHATYFKSGDRYVSVNPLYLYFRPYFIRDEDKKWHKSFAEIDAGYLETITHEFGQEFPLLGGGLTMSFFREWGHEINRRYFLLQGALKVGMVAGLDVASSPVLDNVKAMGDEGAIYGEGRVSIKPSDSFALGGRIFSMEYNQQSPEKSTFGALGEMSFYFEPFTLSGTYAFRKRATTLLDLEGEISHRIYSSLEVSIYNGYGFESSIGFVLNYFISILDYVLPPTCDGSLSSSSKCRRSELALTESNYEITSYAYLKLSYDMYFLNFGGGVFYENIEEDSEYENLRYHISSSKDLSDYWYTRLGFQW